MCHTTFGFIRIIFVAAIIVSVAGVDAYSQAVTIQLEEVLRIGDDESAPLEYLFATPTQMTVRSDGSFFVAEHGRKHIKLFERNGDFIRQFGSAGQGPGEFQDVSALVVDASNRLIVLDRLQQRVTRYSEDGTSFETFDLFPGKLYQPSEIVPLTGGRWALGSALLMSDGEMATGHLVQVFAPDWGFPESSTASAPSWFDMQIPFERMWTRFSPLNLASDGKSVVYAARDIHDGRLMRLEETETGWVHTFLQGMQVEDPFYTLHEGSYSEVRAERGTKRLQRLRGMSGPDGRYVVEYPVSSHAIFTLSDGMVIHFVLTGRGSKSEMKAELFRADGTYLGLAELNGVDTYDVDSRPSVLFQPMALDTNDLLYGVDNSTDAPVVVVLKMGIEYH